MEDTEQENEWATHNSVQQREVKLMVNRNSVVVTKVL